MKSLKHLAYVVASFVIVAGCGSAVEDERPTESEPPRPVEAVMSSEAEQANELTQAMLQIWLAQAPAGVDPDAAMKVLMEHKTQLGKEAEDAWRKVGEHPEYRQLASVRIAQGYLNFACAIVDSAVPQRLAEAEREKYHVILSDAAFKVMNNASEWLTRAEDAEPGLYDGIAPTELRERLPTSSNQVATACDATRAEWMPAKSISNREMLERACASREDGCDLAPKPEEEGPDGELLAE